MKILYLTYNSVITLGILQSQVVTLLKLLAKKDKQLKFILVTCERWKDYRNKSLTASFCKNLLEDNIKVIILPKLFSDFLRVELKKKTMLKKLAFVISFAVDMTLLLIVVIYLGIRKDIDIVHARSYIPGIFGVLMKMFFNTKFVFDPRGILPEEVILARNWKPENIFYRIMKWLEKKIIKNADSIIVLSTNFAYHYKKIYPHEAINIIPCCTDTSHFFYDPNLRKEIRTKLNLENKLVVLFTMGCFVPYQILDEAIYIFKLIKSQDSTASLLLLTGDTQKTKIYISAKIEEGKFKEDITEKDILIMNVPFQEMPAYVNAADVALLVRAPSIVSKVASPVKFAEYLACGVPVIAYKDIGDTGGIIEKYQIGVIIDPQSEESIISQQIKKALNLVKEKETTLSRYALAVKENLSWFKYLDSYLYIYYNLMGKALKN